MKYLLLIIIAFTMNSCVFDSAVNYMKLYNYSDSNIYYSVIYSKVDSLPLEPKLCLFENNKIRSNDTVKNIFFKPIRSPIYRINAYEDGDVGLHGRVNDPQNDEATVTIFIISEKTMREHTWKQIHERQMYDDKFILTEKEIRDKNWRYTYIPTKQASNINK